MVKINTFFFHTNKLFMNILQLGILGKKSARPSDCETTGLLAFEPVSL